MVMTKRKENHESEVSTEWKQSENCMSPRKKNVTIWIQEEKSTKVADERIMQMLASN